ncbi:hypothetical protein EUZ85_02930 [Hahella sp. KA22]|nr:hypothetical protein ENC22_00385 [Hahella sp. KA22]QAY53085.1 hypothetical protein EUZ85_02930 [Hahella sp. KA22]
MQALSLQTNRRKLFVCLINSIDEGFFRLDSSFPRAGRRRGRTDRRSDGERAGNDVYADRAAIDARC